MSAPPLLNTRLLLLVSALGFAYVGLIRWRGGVVDDYFWDAVIGVFLGIYICSRPVANLLDQLYSQKIRWRDLQRSAGKLWLLMNVVATICGWATIVAGATRLALSSN